MSAIVFLSKKAAEAIKNANPDQTSSVDRLTALLALQIINVGVVLATLFIGFLADSFLQTALSVATFVVLRVLTGGFHFRNLDVCFVVSTAVLAAIPHIELSRYAIYAISILSILLIMFFSTKKRIIPVCMILLNVFLVSPIIILSIFFQTITLIQLRRWHP